MILVWGWYCSIQGMADIQFANEDEYKVNVTVCSTEN